MPGQQDGHRHLGLVGQRLLGVDAVAVQLGHGRGQGGVVGVEVVEGDAGGAEHVAKDGMVDVDAAQVLQAVRPADDPEGTLGALDGGSVERPAAQVVDRHGRARRDPPLGGVEGGGRHRLGDQVVGRHAGPVEGRAQPGQPVVAPRGRVGECQPVWAPALGRGHRVDDPRDDAGHERLGRVTLAAEDQRRRVAHPPLERPRHAGRVGGGSPLGRLADDRGPAAHVDDRRHGNAVGT